MLIRVAKVEHRPVRVRGVVLSPRPSVLLQASGTSLRCAASEALVTRALELQGTANLVATVVTNTAGVRLLDLRPTAQSFPRRTPTTDETLNRFSAVLERLTG